MYPNKIMGKISTSHPSLQNLLLVNIFLFIDMIMEYLSSNS